jgi:hypothetical protein
VPLPVPANGVIGSKGRQQVGVELLGCQGRKSAQAREAFAFQVHLAVFPGHVLRFEDLQQVIGNLIVFEFRKAT